MITDAAMPTLPKPPALPSYGMHRVCDFLNMFVRALSGYYGPAGVRMMPVQSQLDAGWNETPSMHARIHACKCFKQVIDNGLRLLMIEPLERM
jgi:arginyl-tRNA synthetase